MRFARAKIVKISKNPEKEIPIEFVVVVVVVV
jgi:hypothetical protein